MANYIERSGLKEDLCCPLCLDLFLRPRSLPCSHSFCHLCLVKCAENTLVNEKFCCPVCKEDTKVDTDKIAHAGIWVTRFPVNYDLLVLAQKERNENDKIKITESDEIMVTTKSDRNILYDCVEITANDVPYQSETWENNSSKKGTEDTEKVTLSKKDKIGQKGASQKKDKCYEIFSLTTSSGNDKTVFSNDCVPCFRNEENQAASVYCLECREMMCCTCKKYHLTNRFSSHHKLIEVNEELLDTNKMEFISTITKCTHHKENEVRYLCTDHDHPCCIECAMVTHRKCNEIVSLMDCKVSAENLQCLEKSMDEEMEYMKSLKEYHLNRKFATYESERIIESKLLNIKEQFDVAYKTFVESIMDELKTKRKANIELIYSQLFGIESFEDDLRTSKEKLKASEVFGNNVVLYLMKREVEKEMDQQRQVLNSLYSNSEFKEFTLLGANDATNQMMNLLSKTLMLHVKSVRPSTLPPYEDARKENETKLNLYGGALVKETKEPQNAINSSVSRECKHTRKNEKKRRNKEGIQTSRLAVLGKRVIHNID